MGNETISHKGGSDSARALLTVATVSVSVLRRIVETTNQGTIGAYLWKVHREAQSSGRPV